MPEYCNYQTKGSNPEAYSIFNKYTFSLDILKERKIKYILNAS